MQTAPAISLRPATSDDLAFLAELYATTRADELELAGFPHDQRAAFCQMQFKGQQFHYQTHFSDAEDRILLRDGAAIGRELIARTETKIFLVDIALLPAHRNWGIGTARVRALIAESEQLKRPISLHAEKMTRAHLLYQREGFVITGEEGAHWKMARTPLALETTTGG